MRALRAIILLSLIALGGCASPESTFLKKVTRLTDAGKHETLPPEKLSAFQHLIRHRLPKPPGNAFDRSAEIISILALESDVPQGDGTEGHYTAVVSKASGVEFWYFEQRDHLPRTDRFYHRSLSAGEVTQFSDLQKRLPFSEVQHGSAAALTVISEKMLRLWSADKNETQTIEAAEVLNDKISAWSSFLESLDAVDGLTCTYVQIIPPSARVLFADPHRKVVGLWTEGDDVRAMISDEKGDGAEKWMALSEGKWEASEPPPPPTTQPVATTSAPATPATTPTSEPSRFSNPGMLAEEESWWTEPESNHTTVWHYVSLSETNSRRVGFVVPTFVFDDDHAAINVSKKLLFILYDGQLISLPIPPAAMIGH